MHSMLERDSLWGTVLGKAGDGQHWGRLPGSSLRMWDLKEDLMEGIRQPAGHWEVLLAQRIT